MSLSLMSLALQCDVRPSLGDLLLRRLIRHAFVDDISHLAKDSAEFLARTDLRSLADAVLNARQAVEGRCVGQHIRELLRARWLGFTKGSDRLANFGCIMRFEQRGEGGLCRMMPVAQGILSDGMLLEPLCNAPR
jgi:hypothetical protein